MVDDDYFYKIFMLTQINYDVIEYFALYLLFYIFVSINRGWRNARKSISVFHTKYLNNCYIDIRININNYDDLKYQFIVSQSDFV